MLRFAAVTIGCKVNQYETQAITAFLRRFGLRDADDPSKSSDLVIINTCCVTSSAAAKSRRAVRRATRNNPNADIIILGCYATAEGETLHQVAAQTGARGEIHVFGHHNNIAGCLQQYLSSVGDPGRKKGQKPQPAGPVRYEKCMRASLSHHPAEDYSCPIRIRTDQAPRVKEKIDIFSPLPNRDQSRMMSEANRVEISTTPVNSLHSSTDVRLPPIETFTGHQRAFVKVQDGCDAACTYCIIPRLRSRVWSRQADEILPEVSNLVANGHKEIVLCGVFLGAYGQPTAVRRKWTCLPPCPPPVGRRATGRQAAPTALPELLRRVAETPGLWRVRLSSLEPGDVTDELLDVFGNCSTVAPHLHLPLQSGSSRILKRMNRQYNREQFLDAVRRIRETLADAAITTDIVVGFPGETETDFDATLDMARQAGFGKIHIFGFSPRPGTAAWNWRTEAPQPEIVKSRCAKLAELERELAENFRKKFIGRTVEALVEQPNSKTPPNCARGMTDRYIEVIFPLAKDLTGQVVPIQITDLSETGLRGVATL